MKGERMRTSERILQEVKKAVIGKDELLEKILMAILANGHILMEDMPGVGKTTIARAFADAMQLDCRRMQFTVDVLPADVTGFSVIDPQTGKTQIRKGAVFTNLFLADEINRTSSRTQAALLEVMEEGSVSVDGITMTLEQPFLVIATQKSLRLCRNTAAPGESAGPFMIRLEIGYPQEHDEIEILKRKQNPQSYRVPVCAAHPYSGNAEGLQGGVCTRFPLSLHHSAAAGDKKQSAHLSGGESKGRG